MSIRILKDFPDVSAMKSMNTLLCVEYHNLQEHIGEILSRLLDQ